MTTTSPPPAGAPPGSPAPAERGRRRRESTERRTSVRTPTVIQLEGVECGAAALAMVLAHFGRHVPLEELRHACGVSRDGAKAANLLRAARAYGMVARGMQMETTALVRSRPPAVLFWKFNHFVVYEGTARRLGRPVIRLNDPAQGRRVVTAEEFDAAFTGIVLTFEPGPDFRRGGRPPRLLADLRARYRSSGGALLLALLASLLLILPGLATPAFTRVFIDRVLTGGDHSFLPALLASMGLAAVVTVGLTMLQQTHLLRVESASSIRSSVRVVRHLLRLPVVFFTQRSPAEIGKRVSSNATIAQILSRDVATTAVGTLLVVVYAGLLWTYDAQLTVVGVGVAMLNIVVLKLVARMRTDTVARLRADRSGLVAASFNGLQLIETLKASGAEGDYFKRWAGFQARVVTGQQSLGAPTSVLAVVPPLLAAVDSGLLLWIGGLRAIDGHMSIGLLVAFQTLITSFSRPVAQLANLGPRLQDVTADLNRLKDIEKFPPAAEFPADEQAGRARFGEGHDSTPVLAGRIELAHVTFGYSPLGKPLLDDFSLRVGPGERVALVGGSGSGKSTVSRLIAGLYEPWSGELLFDDRPRRDYPRDVMGTAVAFVDQDIFLFEGTVRDNVTLWDDSIPDEAVVAALRDAAVYDVVAARPGTIHSAVSEGGKNFSGGQRQRLEIARALVRNPSVLILDEATSALDAQTEATIDDNLRRRGCACVIIAHRLSTVRDSDEIVVLEQGRVAQRGNHHTLAAVAGPYAELIRDQ
ncbi:NHLP family bacteriocin export ABC transporter peptidase/permease/ATPase subunit [Embleya scabrispora]|uniref:NHLP family bacteriocin export ABC transporter peptidase/permease/ATPase subunit n=1 Tax=Embleya scabrispora TaxID=159449 RepID=UPI00037B0BD7|nr:NHLP family bacteriocin export ABC transporter peptidase/permease/ATPase subunit [Embleya scabrispora]MYS83523.1 NHLP family bacteriocin export ABC transporter peptidase/permease/ATPase subunit [Streptomyces sp. SID5474]